MYKNKIIYQNILNFENVCVNITLIKTVEKETINNRME